MHHELNLHQHLPQLALTLEVLLLQLFVYAVGKPV